MNKTKLSIDLIQGFRSSNGKIFSSMEGARYSEVDIVLEGILSQSKKYDTINCDEKAIITKWFKLNAEMLAEEFPKLTKMITDSRGA